MDATEHPRSNMTTRSRAEKFLANANVSKRTSSKISKSHESRKRKLQDVVAGEISTPSKARKAEETESKQLVSARGLSKKPSKVKLHKDLNCDEAASSTLANLPKTGQGQLLSSPGSTKKTSKPNSPKGSEEKRLKRFRQQPPQSYLQKLHRAQTQRYTPLTFCKPSWLTGKDDCAQTCPF
jgi:hypothetical protein